MIREIKWPSWLLISSLFVILFIIIGVGIQTIKSNASHQDQVTVEVHSEQIESGIELRTETKEADDFTSFVSFPFMSKEAIDIPIKNWVDDQEEIFHEEVITASDLLNEEMKAHFNLQSNIHKVNNNIISLHIDVEHFVEQDSVYSYVKTFTVDRKNDKFVELIDVIQKEVLESDALYLLLEEKLKEINEELIPFIHTIPYDELTWSIDENYINFHFNHHELGDNKDILEIHIPIIDVHEYLTDTFEEILLTEEMKEEIIRLEKAATQIPRELDVHGKYVALTFDDGPHSSVTPRVLATLKEYNAKATFYMLSRNVENNPELALRVAYEGHEIANHSNTHVNLNAVNADRIKDEVQNSQQRIENAIGIKPTTFRPPYGEYNNKVIEYALESDQTVINWSVDSLDWKSRNANSIYNMVQTYTRPGAIVLFHDIHEPTADALPRVMEYLSNQGYEFVTVSEILPLIEARETGLYFGE